MSAIDQPILTITGIRKSEGKFQSEGQNVEFSNTVVTVLQPFTEEETAKGANGMKSTEYKIKGAQFYHDYQEQKLPAEAQLLFKLDVTRKVPVAQLVGLDFSCGKSIERELRKEINSATAVKL